MRPSNPFGYLSDAALVAHDAVVNLPATDVMKGVLMATILLGVLLEQLQIHGFTAWMQPK